MVALVLLAIGANATTWYVDPNGSDGHDGPSLATAFSTIQHAIDMADHSDTVLVTPTEVDSGGNERSAEYYESDIDFKGKKITVDGSGESDVPFFGNSATIFPEYGGRGVVFHSGETRDSRLKGFRVYGQVDSSNIDLPADVSGAMWDALDASGGYPGGGAIRIVDSSPTIEFCWVIGWADGGVGGGIAVTGGSPLIVNSLVGGAAYFGGAIYSQNSSLDLVNCLFATFLSPDFGQYAPIILADGGAVNLINALVYNVATTVAPTDPNYSLTAAILSVHGASVLVGNSVIWNDPELNYGGAFPPASGLGALYDGSMSAKSSNVQGSGGSASWSLLDVTDGGGNIDADLNASGGPFAGPGSPLLDAGDDASYNAVAADITTDLIGAPRFSGSHIDIGCLEYVPFGNQPPSLSLPSSAAVDVGCPITIQATATDPDGDTLTYSLLDSPSWASIDSATGEILLNPPSGTAGSFTVTVQVSDGNGGSDQKSITITVCPLLVESVKATRKDTKTVIVTFSIRNTSATATVANVSINSATLGGIATRTALPLLYTSIKPGASKLANVQFTTTQKGTLTLIVNGASSAGPVCTNKQVPVP